MPELSLVSFGSILAMMVGVWALSLVLRDASVVDVFWGLGFVLVAALSLAIGSGVWSRRLLVFALVTVWGLRLSAHILRRNWAKGEDRRYRAFRARWGIRFWWVSLFTVFGLQAVLLFVVSLPVQAAGAGRRPPNLGWFAVAGGAVWAVGFTFEAIGDLQLSRFKADPANRGEVMDRGLWRYTRHPNYFGDAAQWWGVWLVATPTPEGAWSVVGPLLMTFLLLRVSGVSLLERDMRERRPGYADYVRRTSTFVPLPPKRAA